MGKTLITIAPPGLTKKQHAFQGLTPLATDRHPSGVKTRLAMFLARVTGSVIATQKLASMTGQKLLVVEPLRVDPKSRAELVSTQRSFIAVDTVGAGAGQLVLIVQGSSARMAPELEKMPIDTAIVGIVDEVSVEGKSIFKHG